jgi:flagellar hook-basal body complex protein FliE
MNGLSPVSSLLATGTAGQTSQQSQPDSAQFLNEIDAALQGVSRDQNQAAQAESGYAVGAPGATLGKALVASDRAEVAWNATVAVRNEVVTAYQSVMGMQF